MNKPKFKLSNINIYEIGWLISRRVLTRLDMERLRLLRKSTLGEYVFLPHYRLVNRLRDMAHNFQLDCEQAMSNSLSASNNYLYYNMPSWQFKLIFGVVGTLAGVGLGTLVFGLLQIIGVFSGEIQCHSYVG